MQERVTAVEDLATTWWKNSVDYDHDDAITKGVIPIVIVRWSYAGSLYIRRRSIQRLSLTEDSLS